MDSIKPNTVVFDIGTRIRELRIKANLSTTELAEITGISSGYISELETGKKSTPSYEILFKIITGLNITFAAFFNEVPAEPLSPDMKKLVDAASKLNPSRLKALTAIVKIVKNIK